MNKNVKLLSPIVLALASTLPIQSHAAGTAAGSTVTNTASLAYDINGQTQDVLEATDEFVVDIKVDFSLTRVNNAPNTTSLGADDVVVAAFTLANEGNAPTSFNLLANDEETGTSISLNNETYTDTIDVGTTYSYYIDDGNGLFDAADTELAQARTDIIAAGAPGAPGTAVTVFVTVPKEDIAGVDEDVALTNVTVRGFQSEIDTVLFDLDRDGDPANGSSLDDRGTVNTADGIEIVYADGVPDGTVAQGDNIESIIDVLVLNFPNLNDDNNGDNVNDNFTKTSEVISDPFNGTNNPKAIPGAVVEYTITVTNTGSAAANNVVVEDPIPENTQYIDGSVAVTGGTSTDATTSFNKDPQNAGDRGTIRAELGNVDPQETNVIVFRVTID